MSIAESVEKILLDYPAITLEEPPTAKPTTKCFSGNVRVQGCWYRLFICCPQFPILLGMKLRLQHALRVAHFNASSAGVQADWTLHDLIKRLPQLLPTEPSLSQQYIHPETATPNLYAEIAELKSTAYTLHINEECTFIRFSKFCNFPEHYLELELPVLRLRGHSLPDCVAWNELLIKCTTLTALLAQFLKHLEDLREFYAQFVDIDELCYVVQPAHPTTKDNWRLFLLRERVFLKLSISDPFAPASSMSLAIIGATHEVEQLRRCYSEGLKDWDAELDVHKNLLRIFDLCFFPMPPGSEAIGVQVAEPQICNICYCHQLEDGQVPIVSCDNRCCSLIFHAACLREWFNMLSDGKTFLEVSLGACPFCKSKLSTSFAELLTY